MLYYALRQDRELRLVPAHAQAAAAASADAWTRGTDGGIQLQVCRLQASVPQL